MSVSFLFFYFILLSLYKKNLLSSFNKRSYFYNEHKLDRFPEDIEYKRFEATLTQALAWKRLETRTHKQDDVTWIKHEFAERHHELKYGAGYDESHKRAQSRYNGAPWPTEF